MSDQSPPQPPASRNRQADHRHERGADEEAGAEDGDAVQLLLAERQDERGGAGQVGAEEHDGAEDEELEERRLHGGPQFGEVDSRNQARICYRWER